MFNRKIICCYLYVIRKYGYPTPADKTYAYLEEMKEVGFRSIELEAILEENVEWMYERREEIKGWFHELELEMPYFCVILPSFASADPAERKNCLRLFEKGCEMASLFGSVGVLDSPRIPYDFTDTPYDRRVDEDILMSARLPDDFRWSEYWKGVTETYRRACDIAADHSLTFQIHQSFGSLTFSTDAFLNFYDAVDRENIRFNVDTANLYYARDNVNLSLHRLKGLVDYIHIADSRGFKKEHLEPGAGSIDWEDFFSTLKAVGFNGYLGIDVGRSERNQSELFRMYRDTAEWLERKLYSTK